MTDYNINHGDITEINGNGPRPGHADVNAATDVTESVMTLDWICAKIESVINDNAHIKEALAGFKSHGDISGSLGMLVAAREETNQQTLRLLERMYNDLNKKPSAVHSVGSVNLLKSIDLNHAVELMDSDDIADFLTNIASSPNGAEMLKGIDVNHVLELMDCDDIPDFLQKLAGISDAD